MKTKPLPSQNELLTMFRYEASTGVLYWKDRPRSKGRKPTLAGKPAGCVRSDGYTVVKMTIAGATSAFLAHRIIYKMIHGVDPDLVDHRFGVGAGNTPDNIRNSTETTNTWNSKVSKGKILPKNVFKWRKKFRVFIQKNGVNYGNVTFDCVHAAELYAVSLANELHGVFAASRGVALDLSAKQR